MSRLWDQIPLVVTAVRRMIMLEDDLREYIDE
jgi:hypothetical protein